MVGCRWGRAAANLRLLVVDCRLSWQVRKKGYVEVSGARAILNRESELPPSLSPLQTAYCLLPTAFLAKSLSAGLANELLKLA